MDVMHVIPTKQQLGFHSKDQQNLVGLLLFRSPKAFKGRNLSLILTEEASAGSAMQLLAWQLTLLATRAFCNMHKHAHYRRLASSTIRACLRYAKRLCPPKMTTTGATTESKEMSENPKISAGDKDGRRDQARRRHHRRRG